MYKKIIEFVFFVFVIMFNLAAFGMEKNPTVAVMDFGVHKGATTSDISLINAEKTACEYVIDRLVDTNQFYIVDKAVIDKYIAEENLNVTGLIDPDTAQRLGRLLNAKYIIYGNVVDVTLSDTGTQVMANIGGGVVVNTVKAHIIARMMDVSTGDIIMAAKGEGKSKSTYTKVKAAPIGIVTIGTAKVTQDSVHNAIQKAAYASVDLLVKRLEIKK